MTEKKDVVCKKCGFCFCFEKKPEWADTFDGCYTPSYCEQKAINEKVTSGCYDAKTQQRRT